MDVAPLLASLTGAVELSKLLVGERDRQKAMAIQIDLSQKLLEAQAQVAQLLGTVIEQQGRIGALEKRIRDMETREAEKQEHELAKFTFSGEFFAYRLRSLAEAGQGCGKDGPLFCQQCFERGEKVVLAVTDGGHAWCPSCKHGGQVRPVLDDSSGLPPFEKNRW